MKIYGQLPEIRNGVVFSDPAYDEKAWCQYRKEFQDKNWLISLDTKSEYDILTFTMTIGRPTILAGVQTLESGDGFQVSRPERFSSQTVELGMDTACIFCGLKENWDAFAQEAALHTGTDGLFGTLIVFTCKGEDAPAGFLLFGDVDEQLINEQALCQHLLAGFDAKEITPEQFAAKTRQSSLEMRLLRSSEMAHANSQKSKSTSEINMER